MRKWDINHGFVEEGKLCYEEGWRDGRRDVGRNGGRTRARTRGGEFVHGNSCPSTDNFGNALLVYYLSDHA